MDIDHLKAELDEYGFVILERQIPTDEIDRMAARLMEIMRAQPDSDRLDQGLQALIDHDDMFIPLVTNPTFLELARHTLGEGFRLAEVDLQLRGPGEMAGTRQSGIPEFRVANLMTDSELLSLAQKEAQRWVERSGEREKLIEALSARTRFVTVG